MNPSILGLCINRTPLSRSLEPAVPRATCNLRISRTPLSRSVEPAMPSVTCNLRPATPAARCCTCRRCSEKRHVSRCSPLGRRRHRRFWSTSERWPLSRRAAKVAAMFCCFFSRRGEPGIAAAPPVVARGCCRVLFLGGETACVKACPCGGQIGHSCKLHQAPPAILFVSLFWKLALWGAAGCSPTSQRSCKGAAVWAISRD
jgi:hypothetical protein